MDLLLWPMKLLYHTSEINRKSAVQFGPARNVIEEGMYAFRLTLG